LFAVEVMIMGWPRSVAWCPGRGVVLSGAGACRYVARSAVAAITYLNRNDLTIQASETLITYNKTATHAALHKPLNITSTPHTQAKPKLPFIITTNAKLAHTINTNTINNPALRPKEKYQMILTGLHS
jgi:hypothetical protein